VSVFIKCWTERPIIYMRVIKHKVLKKTFGQRREQIVAKWRQLHSKGLQDLYSTPHIFWVFRSRRM